MQHWAKIKDIIEKLLLNNYEDLKLDKDTMKIFEISDIYLLKMELIGEKSLKPNNIKAIF
jgi:hypothetical protein